MPQHSASGEDHGLHTGGHGRHAGRAAHLEAGEQRARTGPAAGAEVGVAQNTGIMISNAALYSLYHARCYLHIHITDLSNQSSLNLHIL